MHSPRCFLAAHGRESGGRYRLRDLKYLKRGNVGKMTVNIANVIIILEFFN